MKYETASLQASELSPAVTFLCANAPSPPSTPTATLTTQDLIIVEWVPPTDGGSPILGY